MELSVWMYIMFLQDMRLRVGCDANRTNERLNGIVFIGSIIDFLVIDKSEYRLLPND